MRLRTLMRALLSDSRTILAIAPKPMVMLRETSSSVLAFCQRYSYTCCSALVCASCASFISRIGNCLFLGPDDWEGTEIGWGTVGGGVKRPVPGIKLIPGIDNPACVGGG